MWDLRWRSGKEIIHPNSTVRTGATKTIPHGAPLPTEHSKITILHGIGCSLNLSISYYCSFVFGDNGCGLLSIGKQSICKLCRMSGHPLLQKARTFGPGPSAPPNKHNRFHTYGAISHKKLYGSFGGRGASAAKSRLFVTEGIMAEKDKESPDLCLWSGPVSFHLLDTESYLNPGTLVRPTS